MDAGFSPKLFVRRRFTRITQIIFSVQSYLKHLPVISYSAKPECFNLLNNDDICEIRANLRRSFGHPSLNF
jgi:hypothetical protein